MLNHIQDILAELQNQWKYIILYKVTLRVRIVSNMNDDKSAKEVIGMPRTATCRLTYTK